ncbi:hypothetical protein CLV31_105160 [Algoriphagus aquaeductus]|uniref:DUF4468 domain-containing protein n=1 Tax=Algoriphagus aquaeductus TaxID=475299 RepID=A0A326RTE1_9BACT|nr:hypothetical protein [Algoriphagus aquaeductus]PZV83934.1 hypothetical protein CLV31_105160 [Algoriphagus aquaeductus]
MKKSVLFFLAAFLSIHCAWAQGHSLELQPKLEQYFLATKTKDWKTVLDMANPKIFTLAPRKMMEQMYSQMEHEVGMRFDFGEMKILDFKEGLVLTDTVYVPVDYTMTLEIYLNPSLFTTEKQIQQLYEGFQIAYSGQQIRFDEETMRFTIKVKNTLIASAKRDSNHWYFGEYKANDPLTRMIFPHEVLERLRQGWN